MTINRDEYPCLDLCDFGDLVIMAPCRDYGADEEPEYQVARLSPGDPNDRASAVYAPGETVRDLLPGEWLAVIR